MAEIIDFPVTSEQRDKFMNGETKGQERRYEREIRLQRDAEQMALLDEELKANPNIKLSPRDASLAAEQLYALIERVRRNSNETNPLPYLFAKAFLSAISDPSLGLCNGRKILKRICSINR